MTTLEGLQTPKQLGKNYQTVEFAMRRMLPFEHRSMSGRWEDGLYVIYSYQTIIGYVDVSSHSVMTKRKYSVTTSKQQHKMHFAMERLALPIEQTEGALEWYGRTIREVE